MDQYQNTVIFLAAGYGKRIRTLTDGPKCLLEIQGMNLLERHFKIWRELGIKRVHLVLGYKQESIRAVADHYADDFDLSVSVNEDYERQGNTFSLCLGIRNLLGPCLIFDADLIYEAHILEQFLKDEQPNQILVGEGSLTDIECTKVLVGNGGWVRILADKRAIGEEELQRYRFVGEAVGILKFSQEYTRILSEMAETFLAKEENISLNWEHLLNQFIQEQDVGTHCFKQGKWIEIDTPEDFEEARRMFEGRHEGNV